MEKFLGIYSHRVLSDGPMKKGRNIAVRCWVLSKSDQIGRPTYPSVSSEPTDCCVKLCINVNVSTVVNLKIRSLVQGPGETDSRSASQKIPLLKNPKVLQMVHKISLLHAFLGQKNSTGYTL